MINHRNHRKAQNGINTTDCTDYTDKATLLLRPLACPELVEGSLAFKWSFSRYPELEPALDLSGGRMERLTQVALRQAQRDARRNIDLHPFIVILSNSSSS